MTKIYALKDKQGKTVSHVTLEKLGKEIALVACDKRGKRIYAGYIAFISVDGIQRIRWLTSNAHIAKGDDKCVKDLTVR